MDCFQCAAYIVMLYFHCLHEFLMHLSFNFPDFYDPWTEIWQCLSSQTPIQSLTQIPGKCSSLRLLLPPPAVERIVSFPDWFAFESTSLGQCTPPACICEEMLYMVLLGNVNKRKTGFYSYASDLMMHYHDSIFIAHASNPLIHDTVLVTEAFPWQSSDEDSVLPPAGDTGSIPGCGSQDPTQCGQKSRKWKLQKLKVKGQV